MKDILALIEERQQTYSQLPFFQFLQDKSINPRKRLSFVPCAAPFIMGFSDLCKYVLRQEPTQDKIQEILNKHTYEDDFHWQWFLEDLEKLGFNGFSRLNNSLIFLWSEETKASRFLINELYKYIVDSDALGKLIIMEAMEATAEIFLFSTAQAANNLEIITDKQYKYFGSYHCESESDHNTRSNNVRKFIENIYIPEEDRQKKVELVEKVFQLFAQWNHELLIYAQNSQVSQPLDLQLQLNREQISKVA